MIRIWGRTCLSRRSAGVLISESPMPPTRKTCTSLQRWGIPTSRGQRIHRASQPDRAFTRSASLYRKVRIKYQPKTQVCRNNGLTDLWTIVDCVMAKGLTGICPGRSGRSGLTGKALSGMTRIEWPTKQFLMLPYRVMVVVCV